MKLEFTLHALHDLARLPKNVSKRVANKMHWFAAQEDPLAFAKPLKDKSKGSYRFRVGAYRVFVDVKRNHITVLMVLAVRHRKEAYRSVALAKEGRWS